MAAKRLLIYDDGLGQWGPMCDLRAAFELRTGAGVSRWRIEQRTGLDTAALVVPPHLAAVVAARYDLPVNQSLEEDSRGNWLIVNGRWTAARFVDEVKALSPGQAVVQADGQLVAACATAADARAVIDARFEAPASFARTVLEEDILLTRPWHILDQLEAALDADASLIQLPSWNGKSKYVHVEGQYPVRISPDAQLDAGVFIDARHGPVFIHHGAVIHSLVTLEGPCYIGTSSQVASHSAIRPNTVIGPVCKVAGEISFSIIHGFSNKAHAGFLGHSLVGQWVNFGADTTVSNLKNTYGPVRVQLEVDGEAEDSRRTFHGPIIGDYVRTAIASRLLTGSVIGTGAMIATSGFPPKCARRFGFFTDKGEQRYDMDRFIDTARTMMARRKIELSAAEQQHLRELGSRC